MQTIAFFALLVFWVPQLSFGDETKYKQGDQVTLWSDKVGPRKNPQMRLPYDHLPICYPDMGISVKKKHEGLGEQVSAFHLVNSGLKLPFNETVRKKSICKQKIDKKLLEFYKSAAINEFRFNMFLDDLPIWGEMAVLMKEEGEEPSVNIYLHKKLTISYNGPYIVEVILAMHDAVKLKIGKEVEYTYEVIWKKSETNVGRRYNKYLEREFFENPAHWISVFNSFMLVAFLCGVVALILVKTLRNDFAKYTKIDEDLEVVGQVLVDDSGWKQVHGDVFRAPRDLTLFAALYGSGCHLIILTCMALCFCLLKSYHGEVYADRGEMTDTLIACYVISAPVAGYTSGRYYRQFFMTPRAEQSSNWQRCMLLTAILVPALVCSFIMPLNIFTAMVKLFCLWIFAVLPLIVFGTMLGRHLRGRTSFPCRTHSIPRQIPISPWYARPAILVLAGGTPPFASIFVELYFTYSSIWRYKVYYMYGLGLLIFIFLVIVVICISIVAVYLTLNYENHHWKWVGFLSGGSTSLYVFLYSCYFFAFDTEMHGFFQSVSYFMQMILFCILLSILCGTIGTIGSTLFVKKIFSTIKVD